MHFQHIIVTTIYKGLITFFVLFIFGLFYENFMHHIIQQRNDESHLPNSYIDYRLIEMGFYSSSPSKRCRFDKTK